MPVFKSFFLGDPYIPFQRLVAAIGFASILFAVLTPKMDKRFMSHIA